jgi:hypothetical protein
LRFFLICRFLTTELHLFDGGVELSRISQGALGCSDGYGVLASFFATFWLNKLHSNEAQLVSDVLKQGARRFLVHGCLLNTEPVF